MLDVLSRGVSVDRVAAEIKICQLSLFNEVVWPLLMMRPNFFIPYSRPFEARRVMSLLVMGALIEMLASAVSDVAVNDSIYVSWRPGKPTLYIWYGQTQLLGRRPFPCGNTDIDVFEAAIVDGHYRETYDSIRELLLPIAAELPEICGGAVH